MLETKSRVKIQDIVPRKNQRDSLLAKIMGPRRAPFRPEKDAARVFLRALPFGRHGGKKPEKVIRLKKVVSSGPVSVSLDESRMEKKPASRLKHALQKPHFFEEVRMKPEESIASQPVSPRWFRFSFWFLMPLGVICFAGIVILLSTVFSRATISLEPSVAELSLEGIRVEAGTAVAEIDAAGKKIPSFLLETAGSLKREFFSSAKESVSRKAAGTVRIYNAFNSAPQVLVARTRLQDSSGRMFRLKQRVTVPGAAIQNGKIEPRFIFAGVEAENAGAEFNIGPGRFTIPGFVGTPKFGGFYAESLDPFTGGFEGEAVVIRQADINAASEEVTAALFAHLKEELERKIPAGATAIQGSREIIITALRKPKAEEAADRFIVEADGRAAVMLFRMVDLFALLGQFALSPDAEKKISAEKSHLEFDKVSLSLKNRMLSFEVRGTVAAVSVLVPDKFQRAISGKTRSDAENILRADSRVRAFGIGIFPPWRRTISSDGEKIRVLVRE